MKGISIAMDLQMIFYTFQEINLKLNYKILSMVITVLVSAAEQWNQLDAYINNSDYLNASREYAKRNAARRLGTSRFKSYF
jgi:hypothetical protein